MPRIANWMLITAMLVAILAAPAAATGQISTQPTASAGAGSAQELIATQVAPVSETDETPAASTPDSAAVESFDLKTVAKVNVSTLNVREGPGLNYQVIGKLTYGAVHTVVGGPVDASGFSWVQLDLNGPGDGWVASTYVTLTEGEPTSTAVVTATPFGNLQLGDRVRVEVSVLNVRSGAGTTYSVISQITFGQVFVVLASPVVSSGFNWVKIDLPGAADGWAATQYLRRVDTAPPTSTPAPTHTSTPTATSSPSPTWTVTSIPTVTPSPTLTSTATETGPPTPTSTPSSTSTATEQVTVTPSATRQAGLFLPGDRIQVVPRLNVRSGPGTSYAVRRVALPGEVATVLTGNTVGGQFTWIQVRFSEITGWVATEYVKLIEPGPPPTVTQTATSTRTPSATAPATPTKSAGVYQPGDTIVVKTGLNVRSGAGTGFSVLAVASAGTQGTVLTGNTPAGSYQWIRVQIPSLTGWVATDWVTHLGMTTPTPVASTSNITIALNCSANPERITITNNNASAITIISIGTLYDPLPIEPFVLDQALGAGGSRTYLAGSQASGQFRLTSSHILTDSAGSNEGVTVVTSAGTVTKRCPAASSSERWVEVDLSEQYMRVYQGTTLITGTYVSTGRYGFDTPVGTYRTWLRYTSQTMSGCIQGECYVVPNVPWVQYFTYEGHALHGAYWHNNFGTRMSHGCVNLPVPFAEWLYYWLPSGSRVVVKQ
ncbi:MAG: SH3 domain-containing protein [Thermomicrobiales bacterium]|nr:SH3 domain-containing protein [Thermomicrobiales bacterium]